MSIEFKKFYDKSKTAKHGNLKFGHNITSLQSIMHANFGGRRLRDNDLGTLKPKKKTGIFEKFFYFAFNKKSTERVELRFGHNMGRDRRYIRTKFKGSQSRDQNF